MSPVPAQPSPTKLILTAFGAMVSGMGLAGAIHARLVVPAIMRQVVTEIDERIEKHRNHGVHPGALLREEYLQDRAELLRALDKLATKESVQAVFDRLELLAK